METANQHVKKAALKGSNDRLKRAAKFVEVHAPKVLFSKTVKVVGHTELVRIESPGVLRVFDNMTGELLAESIPGKLDQPNPDFCPPLAI
jgi:hypothetical protein